MKWALLIVVAGCGRLHFDPLTGGDAADATSDASGPAPLCGSPQAVGDNFDDGVMAANWTQFADPGTAIAETGGELAIALANNASGATYAGYVQNPSTSFVGGRVFVEVTQVPAAGAVGAQAYLQLAYDGSNELGINESAGSLSAVVNVLGTTTTIALVPYDRVAQRWWQLREAAGTTYFETSPDGVTFTPFAMTSTPAFAPFVHIDLYAGTFQASANPGEAHYDNLNGGAATASWCKADTFVDGFDAGAIGDPWQRQSTAGGCRMAENGGQVVMNLATAGDNGCAIIGATDYDLTGTAIFASIATTPNQSQSTYSYVRATLDNYNEQYVLGQNGTQLQCLRVIAGVATTPCSIPFDPVAHHFWRLDESGGMLTWSTSPDGTTWTPQTSAAEPYDFRDVTVAVGAGANGANGAPGAAAFDAYNR